MDLQEIVYRLLHQDGRSLRQMTRGCRECRSFLRQLHRKHSSDVGWAEIPAVLLDRFSRRLHEQLFQY